MEIKFIEKIPTSDEFNMLTESVGWGKRESKIIEENQKEIRKMVMDSYQDMVKGKGRDYKEFFAELEDRYKKNV